MQLANTTQYVAKGERNFGYSQLINNENVQSFIKSMPERYDLNEN